MLIHIDGIEYTGKSTYALALQKHLKSLGYSSTIIETAKFAMPHENTERYIKQYFRQFKEAIDRASTDFIIIVRSLYSFAAYYSFRCSNDIMTNTESEVREAYNIYLSHTRRYSLSYYIVLDAPIIEDIDILKQYNLELLKRGKPFHPKHPIRSNELKLFLIMLAFSRIVALKRPDFRIGYNKPREMPIALHYFIEKTYGQL